MIPVFKKDFSAYFRTNSAYFIIGLYLVAAMLSSFYASYFFQLGNADLFSFFRLQPQLFAVIIPVITMRAWAEEKKTGTIEFLLTQPVGFSTLIKAKFFAAWAFAGLMLFCTLPFILYCSFLIDLDFVNIASGILGCLLVVGAFTAIGCLVSSFFASPVLAWLISFFLCWGLSFTNFSFLFPNSPLLQKSVNSLNFYKHYQEFLTGQIGLDNFIYFAAIIFFALVINTVVLETQRGE